MKLRMSKGKTILACIITIIVTAGLIFATCFRFFLTFPWEWQAYALSIIWIVTSIIFFVISLTQNYYILNKKEVIVHRFFKEIVYDFNNVIYINEELSEKKKMIFFYTKQGKVHYLNFDEKGTLYETMLRKCPNLMGKEEFEIKYPNVKW